MIIYIILKVMFDWKCWFCHLISHHHVFITLGDILQITFFLDLADVLSFNMCSSHSRAQSQQLYMPLHPSEISAEENHCFGKSLHLCQVPQLVTLCLHLPSGHITGFPIPLVMGECGCNRFLNIAVCLYVNPLVVGDVICDGVISNCR